MGDLSAQCLSSLHCVGRISCQSGAVTSESVELSGGAARRATQRTSLTARDRALWLLWRIPASALLWSTRRVPCVCLQQRQAPVWRQVLSGSARHRFGYTGGPTLPGGFASRSADTGPGSPCPLGARRASRT